jgi:nucleoid DNA-binding protein
MSKATLVDVVREHTECTVGQAKETVDALFYAIGKTLKKEGAMPLVGFGTFKVSKRAARMGRNPRTGAAIKIAASRTVRFKASKQLKEAI